MKKKRIFGNVLLLVTAMIWGTAFAAQRVGMELIEPITFNAARMALAAVFIGGVAIFLWKKEKAEPAKRSPEEQKEYTKNTIIGGILCGTFLNLASIAQQMGIVYTSAGKAGFITAMYMLLVPIINFLIFKKKNTLLVWLAVLLGVGGMYLLCITDDFKITGGDSLVALCALFFSCHILCCDHFSKKGNPIRISAIQFVTATVISTVIAAFAENPTKEKLISAFIPIAYCGIMSGGIGYTLQIIGQRYTEPTVASLLMSLEAVFAVIAGAILLSERMSTREIIGCIVMMAAIVLVQIPMPNKEGERL